MQRWFLVFGTLAVALPAARAETLRIAAATSLAGPARALAEAFEKETGNRLSVTFGASGTLFAQITSGAPFSVFLSADTDYPRKLEERGLVAAGGARVYARGRLLLWVADRSGLAAVDDAAALLRSAELKRLAIADPRVAPYGAAAVQLLDSLGLDAALEGRLVYGESVAQAAHLARSGAADAALLAGSLRGVEELNRHGRWVAVPDRAYDPIEHGLAVVAGVGGAAAQFVDWLLNAGGREVLAAYGLEPAVRAEP